MRSGIQRWEIFNKLIEVPIQRYEIAAWMPLPDPYQNDNEDLGATKRNKAKYITLHNNYKDVLTLGKTYDICEEKEEWLLIQDDRGECQYYRKDCFEIMGDKTW